MVGYPEPEPQVYPSRRARDRPRPARLLVPLMFGAAVAVGLGVYGRRHTPGRVDIDFGFSSVIAMKVWFGTAAGALAVVQMFSALWLWRRLPFGEPPGWLGGVHRLSGTLAFLFTVPVAYACLYGLGFQQTTSRVLLHSILGCAFYGAFVTKLIVLRVDRLPGWALPLIGGLLFTALIGVVLASAVYTFATVGSPGF